MTITKQVKCSKCNVALQRVADPNPENRHACPSCGQGDRLDQIMIEVREYVAEKARDGLSASLQRATSRSKHLKHTPAPRRHKEHRFIVDTA